MRFVLSGPPPNEQRLRRQGGQAMIEAAMVLVPFLALFFALFDFGMAIFLKNTVQYAVRQGVRYAITSQTQSGYGHDASIKNVVATNTMGFLNYIAPTGVGRPCSGTGCVVIRYYNPQTLLEVTGVNSNGGGNVVQVSAENLTWAWMVPLLRSAAPLQFSVSSADIMESINGAPPAR